jgi:hypothetical protein
MQQIGKFSCHITKSIGMKSIFIFLLIVFSVLSCKKDKETNCYTERGIGRIIGYDPCGYYKSPNSVNGAGFVIEIDKGTSKDTVVTYQIPDGLFEFPTIDYLATIDGSFLFPVELQNRYKVNFNYKVAAENEKQVCICTAIVNVGPYYQAVKNKQILISSISKP